jgi:hypothetical protein
MNKKKLIPSLLIFALSTSHARSTLQKNTFPYYRLALYNRMEKKKKEQLKKNLAFNKKISEMTPKEQKIFFQNYPKGKDLKKIENFLSKLSKRAYPQAYAP